MSPANLNSRVTRLERTLGTLPCSCPNNAELSWPGHQPDPHCARCGGERRIYPLAHQPGPAEALLRQTLPIIQKAYGNNQGADLSQLSNHELHTLKKALQATLPPKP